MRKFYLIIAAVLLSCNIGAQKLYDINPSPSSTERSSTASRTEVAEDEINLTWLTNDTYANSFGLNGTGILGAFMEFYPEDLVVFDKENKKRPTSIKNVQFYIPSDQLSIVSGCRVVILEGSDISTATEKVSQTVEIADLSANWNIVELENAYNVDVTEIYHSNNLYIGYEVQIRASGYPLGVANGRNTKQGWITVNGSPQNIYENNFMFLIKALASAEDIFDDEIMVSSVNTSITHGFVGENFTVESIVKNLGANPVTSFKVKYDIAGNEHEEEITGINISTGESYTFAYPETVMLEEPKYYNCDVTVYEPNGVSDAIEENNFISVGVISLDPETDVQRVVLHEGFSSSTCGPCNNGNVVLKRVLDQADPDRYVSIKYQMNFPGVGDPYYTEEVGIRGSFYGGVGAVPQLNVNGTSYVGSPSSYNINRFNQYAEILPYTKLTGYAEVENQTVDFTLTYEPLFDGMDLTNIRVFAAVAEKTTTKNRKSNGETIFYNVLKKFITSPYGDELEKWNLGEAVSIPYTYTFQGEYRLPSNSSNPINHETEHSVEDFGNLQVLFWIQDISTYEIYQAGKTDAIALGISNQVATDNDIKVFPNPVQDIFTVQSNTNLMKIEVIDVTGRTVKEVSAITTEHQVNIEELPTGIYMIRITTGEGTFVQKIQRQ